MLIKKESILNALGVFKDTKHANRHFMNGIETAKELINQAEEIELSYDDIFGTSWIAENCDAAYAHGVMDGKDSAVITCEQCACNNKCMFQSFVIENGKYAGNEFDSSTFYCADGKAVGETDEQQS